MKESRICRKHIGLIYKFFPYVKNVPFLEKNNISFDGIAGIKNNSWH